MPPVEVRPQTFDSFQSPDSASPAVRLEKSKLTCGRNLLLRKRSDLGEVSSPKARRPKAKAGMGEDNPVPSVVSTDIDEMLPPSQCRPREWLKDFTLASDPDEVPSSKERASLASSPAKNPRSLVFEILQSQLGFHCYKPILQ